MMTTHKEHKSHPKHHEEHRDHRKIWQKEEPEDPKRDNKKEWAKWVVRSLGMLLILLAVLGGLMLYRVNGAQIAVNVINLRSPTLETMQKSSLVSLTDSDVKSMDSPRIRESWQSIIDCLDAGCEDKVFYGMLYTMAVEGKIPHNRLIHDVIITQRYWATGENILIFSKALTDVNSGVQRVGSVKVTKKWQEAVKCDGTCAEKDNLFFSLIKEIVKVQE